MLSQKICKDYKSLMQRSSVDMSTSVHSACRPRAGLHVVLV